MKIPLIIIVLLFPLSVFAKDKTYEDFKNVTYIRNYDGDTITVSIKGIHRLFGEEISIRIRGIDTPEIRSRCKTGKGKENEKSKARTAKRLVANLLKNAKRIDLKNTSRGKYFRIVADVIADGKNIAQVLIKNKLAVTYDGGTKTEDWCSNSVHAEAAIDCSIQNRYGLSSPKLPPMPKGFQWKQRDSDGLYIRALTVVRDQRSVQCLELYLEEFPNSERKNEAQKLIFEFQEYIEQQ